jgi:dihydrodipicolinate synthase/N-acetylneuraminate lyase
MISPKVDHESIINSRFVLPGHLAWISDKMLEQQQQGVFMQGIVPIVFVPFTEAGVLDEIGLRRVVRFELEGGADGIGINGFASEAYKLTDQERAQTAEIVADEVAKQVPLVIGIAAGSTEAAVIQMKAFRKHEPAVFMVLPPATFDYTAHSLVEHYVNLANSSDVPIMMQHSPHIAQYSHVRLETQHLAEMANRASGLGYFKIEGPGAPARMRALKPLIPENVKLFGGVGGISFLEELEVGVGGVIPGVGFNEVFQMAWQVWNAGDKPKVHEILTQYQPLVNAVSIKGHEFSLHARKHLAKRAGLISSAKVRSPTVAPTEAEIGLIFQTADTFELRISRKTTGVL